MKNRNILISGASVAGPALAFWLSRYGFRPTIVERAPTVRPGGYAVDFRGASMQALERMGMLAEVQRLQTRTGAITIVDSDNRKSREYARRLHKRRAGDHARRSGRDPPRGHTRIQAEYIFDDSIAGTCARRRGVDVTFSRSGPTHL